MSPNPSHEIHLSHGSQLMTLLFMSLLPVNLSLMTFITFIQTQPTVIL